MIIRDCTEADFTRLREIHAKQGIEYPLDLSNPLFDFKLVAEENGQIQQAVLVRVTSECYLLMDKEIGTPKEKWGVFQTLHNAACARGWQRGFSDTNLWLDPRLDKSFGRRLLRLGWAKNQWPTYTKILEAV